LLAVLLMMIVFVDFCSNIHLHRQIFIFVSFPLGFLSKFLIVLFSIFLVIYSIVQINRKMTHQQDLQKYKNKRACYEL